MPAPAKTPDSHPDDPTQKDFVLNSDDSKFTNRSSSVFGSLDTLEQEHIRHVRQSDFNEERSMWKDDPNEEVDATRGTRPSSSRGRDRQTCGRRGGGFKRPFPSDQRSKPGAPGYKTEPSKWKRYDLGSVPSADMSEKSNTKAALDFLSEMKERKESDKMDVDESEGSHHIVFKKPSKKAQEAPTAAGTSFQVPPGGGKIVMQEYEIGNAKKPTRPKRSASAAAAASCSAAVGLEHLKDLEGDTKVVTEGAELENVAFKGKFKKKSRGHIRERKTEDEDEG